MKPACLTACEANGHESSTFFEQTLFLYLTSISQGRPAQLPVGRYYFIDEDPRADRLPGLNGLDLIGRDFTGSRLKKAKLNRAQLQNSTLKDVELDGAQLKNANLAIEELEAYLS